MSRATAVADIADAIRELLGGHEASLFQQRQVHVRLVVALDAGIAVPVPGAADAIACFVDARPETHLAQAMEHV